MKKLLKVFLILTILLAFSMNLSAFAVNTENTDENVTDSVTTESTPVLASAPSNSQKENDSTKVGSVSYIPEEGLQLSDILNILLIATGVVIILLAIAIFIKLK